MAIVSFESVAAAAETLTAAGKNPSVRTITAELGGGSPNEILKYLREWKGGRPVVRPAELHIDVRITEAIGEQIQRVAAEASSAAEERAASALEDLDMLSESQQALDQQIASVTAERDEAFQQMEGLSIKLRDLEASAARDQQHAVEQMAALSGDLATARAHHEATVAQLAKSEVRLEVIPGLQAEVSQLRASLDEESRGRIVAEQTAAVQAAELKAAEKRMAELDARLAKADAALVEAQGAAKKATEEAAELRGKVSILEANAAKNAPAPTVAKE